MGSGVRYGQMWCVVFTSFSSLEGANPCPAIFSVTHWDRCGCWDIRECQGKWGPARNGAVAPRGPLRDADRGWGEVGKRPPASLHCFVQPKHVSENLECMSVTDRRKTRGTVVSKV